MDGSTALGLVRHVVGKTQSPGFHDSKLFMPPTLTQDFLNACFAMLLATPRPHTTHTTTTKQDTFSSLAPRHTTGKPHLSTANQNSSNSTTNKRPRRHTRSSGRSCSWCNHSIPPIENYARLHPCSCDVCVGCLLSGHARRGSSPFVCSTCDSTIESHVFLQSSPDRTMSRLSHCSWIRDGR